MRRLGWATIGLVIALAIQPLTGWGSWTVNNTGSGTAVATWVLTPAAPTVTKMGGNARIAWLQGTLAQGTIVTSYIVHRTVGATTTVICTRVEGPARNCNDTSPVTVPATYTVTNVYKSWTGAASPGTTFTFDTTDPVTTLSSLPPPNAAGWNKTAPTLTLTATDAGSGVASITYKIGPAAAVTVNAATTSFAISATGNTTITYSATDVAGNVESTKTYVVKLDTGAPTTTRTHLPAPNAAGWNSSTPTITLNATDSGTSGVDSITYQVGAASPVTVNAASTNFTVTAQGSTTVTYYATDRAGNIESTNSFIVKRDAVAPVLTITSPVEGVTYGGPGNPVWGASCGPGPANQGICGTAPAPVSGVQSLTFTLSKEPNKCWNGVDFVNGASCASFAISMTGLPNWFHSIPDSKIKKGDYVLVVTVTSVSGLTTTLTRSFEGK